MEDLNGKTMSELIAMYNTAAEKLGIATETEFKNLKAARTAVMNIENQLDKAMNPADTNPLPDASTPTPTSTVHNISDDANQKYNSTGKRGPNQGVGAYAKELIKAGKSNVEALAAVCERFPDAKTSKGCIAFYRTALARDGKAVGPTPEALRAQAQELLAKAEAAEQAAAEQAAAEQAAITAAMQAETAEAATA